MRNLLVLFLSLISLKSFTQIDTVKLSRAEAETIFLDKNFDLIISRSNIDLAEAEMIQAKVWPNPNLSISEFNLWNTGKKYAEELPYLIGKWGNFQQFSIELEQTLFTGGKRKKLIAMEKANAETVKLEFEELLRNLKFEFRNALTELQFLQRRERIYHYLTQEQKELIDGYKNQYRKENISQSELIRMQSLEIEFNRELNSIRKEKNDIIKELKILMGMPAEYYLVIIDDADFIPDESRLELISTLESAEEALANRPDLKAVVQKTEYFNKKLEYENALSIPDLSFSVNYDRGGSIMRDFIGFGVSMNLPVFDKNKGNIQIAQIEIEQSQMIEEQLKSQIRIETAKEIQNLYSAIDLFEQIDPDYEANLDSLLPAYKRNFMQGNINLLEYVDFIDSYIESKEGILELKKDILNHFESLQFILGIEI